MQKIGKDILCGNAFLGLSDNKSIIKEKVKRKIDKLNFKKKQHAIKVAKSISKEYKKFFCGEFLIDYVHS